MATNSRQPQSLTHIRARRRGARAGSFAMVGLVAVVAVLVAAGGGVWWWVQKSEVDDDTSVLLHTVARDNFELTVTERGEVEAFDVTEIRSLVKSNNTAGIAILRIVPEGTEVKTGDFLVELDSSALGAQRTSQKILVNAAKALEVEAQNNYDVAVIAKREYLDGTYVQERQVIESEVFVAEENLNRSKEYYTYSKKLASKGYVNENQLLADRFAVEKAKKDLDAAKTKLRVLDEYTKPKMVSTLDSAVLIAKAKLDSAQNSQELELEKLADLDDQIAKCTIVAPQDGIVKYAHETDRRGDQEYIVEEGAIVRERQAIILLPNADSMRVNLVVNESLVQYVRQGLPATIKPIGFDDRLLHGEVEKVNQYAEPSGWRQANVKEYKAFVAISDPPTDLRSGMTAAVTIRCAEVPDALQVPVQSVYAHGNGLYCFAYAGGQWKARQVVAGPTNDKFFVINSGLNEGDRIAMNPRAYLADVALPKLSPEEAQRAVPQPPSARRSEQTAKQEGGGRKAEGGGPAAVRSPQPSAVSRQSPGEGEHSAENADAARPSGSEPSALRSPPSGAAG